MSDMLAMMKQPRNYCATAGDVWASIDTIAEMSGMSLGRLALTADLDQSTFTPSRRARNALSLSTILKLLDALDLTIGDWAELVEAEVAKRIDYERRRGL